MKINDNENYKLIERLVKDEVEVTHLTDQEVYVNRILSSYLTKNEDMNVIIRNFLYYENGCIGQVLKKIFSYNADGISGRGIARNNNLFPIVLYAIENKYFFDNAVDDYIDDVTYLRSEIDSISRRLKSVATKECKMSMIVKCNNAAFTAREIYDQLVSTPELIKCSTIYGLIVENWEVLKEMSSTYNILREMVTNNNDTAELRLKLLYIIKDISASWN